jgi:hypothetical protein
MECEECAYWKQEVGYLHAFASALWNEFFSPEPLRGGWNTADLGERIHPIWAFLMIALYAFGLWVFHDLILRTATFIRTMSWLMDIPPPPPPRPLVHFPLPPAGRLGPSSAG